jgi:hypothetical protein
MRSGRNDHGRTSSIAYPYIAYPRRSDAGRREKLSFHERARTERVAESELERSAVSDASSSLDPAADRAPDPVAQDRFARHRRYESELSGMSDAALVQWLSNADVLRSRFASIPVPGSDDLVFVKLLPLTAFELQAENRHATSNARCLPTYYQHRFGGAGFGSWRELEVQRAAHQWVTSGRCESFPLLHHWRLLPIVGEPHEDTLSTARWGDNAAIAQRVEEVAGATHSIALFLESFPHTLAAWLRSRLTQEPNDVEVLRKTETALTEILRFMSDEGVLHLDAHFENILTDGERLYLGDFGLALSRSFELQPDEFAFFERHANFDRCTVVTSLVLRSSRSTTRVPTGGNRCVNSWTAVIPRPTGFLPSCALTLSSASPWRSPSATSTAVC